MFNKSSVPVYLFIGLVITLSFFFRANKDVSDSKPATTSQNTSFNVFSKIQAVKIPAVPEFACEEVPIHDFDVHERLDRELLVNTYWHSNTLQLFKLASRYFPVIEPILKEHGIPDDFKYLALAESGLRNCISPSNAVGFWQILPESGRELGLEVNKEVDERYHIEMSTIAACKYLKKSYSEFGNWTLAAASYNMGRGRLKKIIKEQQVKSYYDLFMNEETSRYVFRIIALKTIFNNCEKYGFYLKSNDLYEPIKCRSVKVEESIENLPEFALENGTNYKTLKLLNPWIKQPYLKSRKGKSYTLMLPES